MSGYLLTHDIDHNCSNEQTLAAALLTHPVNNKIDVSVGYLEYRHPVLVANIVSEHEKFIAQEKQKKIQVATAKALEQFARIEESKINSMKEQVAKNIHQETGLSKTIVKNAVEAACKANYLN